MKLDKKGSSIGSVNEFAGVHSRGAGGDPNELATTEEGAGEGLELKSECSHSGSGAAGVVGESWRAGWSSER